MDVYLCRFIYENPVFNFFSIWKRLLMFISF